MKDVLCKIFKEQDEQLKEENRYKKVVKSTLAKNYILWQTQ